MAITKAQHDDLRVRLEMLMSEYAAASDRTAAVAKAHDLLERIEVAEQDGPSFDQGQRMVEEIDRRGEEIGRLTAANEALARELEAVKAAVATAASGGGGSEQGAGGGHPPTGGDPTT